MDKVNLKWDPNTYNISHMKFNASSHGKIPAPLAYIRVAVVKFLILPYGNLERKEE